MIFVAVLLIVAGVAGMVALVSQNARRIKQGRVSELHPISVRALMRPSLDALREAKNAGLVGVREYLLSISHAITYKIGRKLIEIAWLARGKKNQDSAEEGIFEIITRGLGDEKDRIKEHFVKRNYPVSVE